MVSIREKIWNLLVGFLIQKDQAASLSPNDLDCMRSSIRPGDVLLVEGRSRVGYIIKVISRSSWSHAALCIGSLNSMKDKTLAEKIATYWQGDPDEPLLVESEIDRGTVVTPLSHYSTYHMRICRPIGLTAEDRDAVMEFMAGKIGTRYDVKQLLDLARFLIPWWTIIPRRWHSTLFEHNAGDPTKAVCSSLIAEAFTLVDFPILPLIQSDHAGAYRVFRRNPRLYAPRDFDYSPYFDVVKCPMLVAEHKRWGRPRKGYYRKLVWIDHPDPDHEMHETVSNPNVLHVGPDNLAGHGIRAIPVDDENCNEDDELLPTFKGPEQSER